MMPEFSVPALWESSYWEIIFLITQTTMYLVTVLIRSCLVSWYLSEIMAICHSEAQVRYKYNALHSAARCVIERPFGRLKGKFHRLKMLDVTRVDSVPIIVEAACILHNVCLRG